MSENTWQDQSGKKWAKNQAKTDAQLGSLADSAYQALALVEGERVLDVGCGTGQTLVDLRERVGATGRVIGLDISPPMLEGARSRIVQKGYENVECILGDAATMRIEPPVDAIFSRFGVMFFDDSIRAFQNLLASLKAHGRMSFVCWQPLEENLWASEPIAAIRQVLPGAPLPELLREGEAGPFRFGDAAYTRHVLESAGFQDIQVTPERREIVIGGASTLAEALEFTLEIGPAARMISEADPMLAPDFRRSLEAILAKRLTPRGVVYEAALLIVSAARRS